MSREERIEDYKKYLYVFCKQSAYLDDIARRVEKGEVVSEKEMTSHLFLLRSSRDALIAVKEELGYEGGIDFTDDCSFYGFRYVKGQLKGDVTKLPDIVLPWIEEFDESKVYTYEVGTLLLFHYMVQKKRGEKELRKRRIKKMFSKIMHVGEAILLFLMGVKKEDLETYE